MEAEEDEAVENRNEPSLNNFTTTTAVADMHAQEEPQNCGPESELDRSQLSESRESPPPQQPLPLEEGEGGDVFVKEDEELVNGVAAESRLGEEGGGSDESRQPEGEAAAAAAAASTVAGKVGDEDLVCRQESREVETSVNELAAESRRGEEEGGSVELRPPEEAPSVAGKSGGEDLIGGEETEGVEQILEAGQPLVTGERDDKELADREENKVYVNSLNSPTPLEHTTARDDKEDEDVVGGASSQVVVEPKMELKTEESIPEADKVVDVAEEMEMPDVVEVAQVAEEKNGIEGETYPAVEPKRKATTAVILEENKVSGLALEGNLMEKIGGHEEAEKAKEKEVEKMEEKNGQTEVSEVAVEREVADVAQKLESDENKVSGLAPEGDLLKAEKAEGKGEEKEVEKMEERNEEKEVSEVADVAEKLESEEADMAEGMEAVEGTRCNVVEEMQLEGGETAAGIGKEKVARMEDADMEMADVVEAIDNVEKTQENGIDEETEMANVAEEAGKVQESATEVTEVAEEMERKEVEEPEMMEESEMADAAEETERAVEETVVAEETEVEEASRNAGGKRKRGKSSKAPVRAPLKKKTEEDVCFICFDGGDLVLCDRR